MSEVLIITNPTDTQINEGLDEAEELVVLHNLKSEGHLREWELDYKNLGYEIIYIHFYASDKTYTMGINQKLELYKTRD